MLQIIDIRLLNWKMIIFDLLVAIGPVYGYIAQLNLIKKQQSMGSFSIYVCAILLIANILRIYFWLTTGFAFNLLLQSIFIIAVQLLLLKQCVQLSDQTGKYEKFWHWATYEQYIKFLLSLTAVLTVLTLIFQLFTFGWYGQLVGFASMSIEATLGFPQLISNYQTKSVKGLSITMIATWFIGDFFKTIYFIVENQPFQFVMCGAIQLTVDILIIVQIIYYGKFEKPYNPINPVVTQ